MAKVRRWKWRGESPARTSNSRRRPCVSCFQTFFTKIRAMACPFREQEERNSTRRSLRNPSPHPRPQPLHNIALGARLDLPFLRGALSGCDHWLVGLARRLPNAVGDHDDAAYPLAAAARRGVMPPRQDVLCVCSHQLTDYAPSSSRPATRQSDFHASDAWKLAAVAPSSSRTASTVTVPAAQALHRTVIGAFAPGPACLLVETTGGARASDEGCLH